MAADTTDKKGEDCLPDIAAANLREEILIPHPANRDELLRRKKRTAARLGCWRCGPRCLTGTLLRFRADHAAAMDAVFTEVSEEFLSRCGLFAVSTLCRSKDEYLTKPYLGRKFSAAAIALIREKCRIAPSVQIYVSDGLSGAAIEANAEDTLQSARQGLEAAGIDCGAPFFVRYGRVRAMDEITAALNAKVTVVLIGERPGLATAESMSAYISYMGYPGMPENNNIVVANIHQAGTPPVEAGAYIAHVAGRMLGQKVLSVHDLKL